MTDPAPLTDDELARVEDELSRGNWFPAAAAASRLVAAVEQARSERDAAYAVIRKADEFLTLSGFLVALSDVLEPAEIDAVRAAVGIPEEISHE